MMEEKKGKKQEEIEQKEKCKLKWEKNYDRLKLEKEEDCKRNKELAAMSKVSLTNSNVSRYQNQQTLDKGSPT